MNDQPLRGHDGILCGGEEQCRLAACCGRRSVTRKGPVHACWFCAGPEHFAAVAASVASAALQEGQAVYVLGSSAFLEAFRASLPLSESRLLTAIDTSTVGPGDLARVTAETPCRTLVIHTVDAAYTLGINGNGVTSRERLQEREQLLGQLADAGLVRCLCAYDLSAVCAWQADTVAEQHHRYLATGGRLVPLSEALELPVESPPPALSD